MSLTDLSSVLSNFLASKTSLDDEEDKGNDLSRLMSSRLWGLETHFNKSMKLILDSNVLIHGTFDFVVVPLMSPRYRSSLAQQSGSFSLEPLLPYTKSDISVTPTEWNRHVIGKISEWIDLDSPDPILRKDSETAFKQEIAWASYLNLRKCLLPTPKGNTWTNYARCVKRILQDQINEMQLLLRIPLGKPDDDSIDISRTPADFWKTWNSFRLLCDHNTKLFVALDNMSTIPSDNSLNSWYGEPVAAYIIHTNSFFTRGGDNLKHLSEDLQKLIVYFFNHETEIIISEVQLRYIKVYTNSAEDSERHRLLPYIDYLKSLYKQVAPNNQKERIRLAIVDITQDTLHPFKENMQSDFYQNQELDMTKFTEYKRAISQALLDRVPYEKASVITTVLVVVGAGRGALVWKSIEAASETGRKLKIYAVERNLNALASLYKLLKKHGWNDIVTVVQTNGRYWNVPERADILVTDMLGSFGDNLLAPEFLYVAQRFLKEDGISIPSSYTSFLQPVKDSKLYSQVKTEYVQCHNLRSETSFDTIMHNVARLAPYQRLFTFTHPKRFYKEPTVRYKKLQFVMPDDPESTMVHGFAGYFDATLYKDVHVKNEPSKATIKEFAWFEMYFPLREPICVQHGSILEVDFWRFCDSRKVWYEWCVTSPSTYLIHNCYGRAHCMWL